MAVGMLEGAGDAGPVSISSRKIIASSSNRLSKSCVGGAGVAAKMIVGITLVLISRDNLAWVSTGATG
jgi:hypothetical protein